MGPNEKLVLTAGNFQMIVGREHLVRTAVEMTALNKRWAIGTLNAPGRFLAGLLSKPFAQRVGAFPDSIDPFIWQVFSFSLFSIPAWFFVGRGLDGILLRRKMRQLDLVLSAALVLLSVAISAGLRFGLSASERDEEFTVTFIYGFALWSLLFALPLAGWMRQRLQRGASVGHSVTE